MEQSDDRGTLLSKDFQSVLFSTEYLKSDTSADDQDNIELQFSGTQFLSVDSQSLDKWVPELRRFIEKGQMDTVLSELNKSIQDNFQDSDLDFVQNPKINDQLMNSIKNLSLIQKALKTTRFQEQLGVLQEQLTDYTDNVVFHKKQFLKNKKTHSKINETSALINKILQILELSNNCHQLILSSQYYKALQSLDSLDIIYSQGIRKEFNFDFLSQFYQSIPLFKEIIRDESINLIKNFFNSNLEKNLYSLGSTVFQTYNEDFFQDWLVKRGNLKFPSAIKFNSSVEISLRDIKKQSQLSPANWFNIESFHDAILIFDSMNQSTFLSNEFSKIYQFWQNKFVHPLEFDNNLTSINASPNQRQQKYSNFQTVEQIQKYLFKITGFLIFDRYLQRETEYTLTQDAFTMTDTFWNKFSNNFIPYLQYYIKNSMSNDNDSDHKDLHDLNLVLGMFISIFSALKLDTASFQDCHVMLFKKYSSYQHRAIAAEFTELLKDDDFMPLSLNNKKLYKKIMQLCWLKDSDKELLNDSLLDLPDSEFHVSLPFSPLYPMTCSLLKKVFVKLDQFVENFASYQSSNIFDMIIDNIDSLFNDIMIAQFEGKLGSKSREELTQILINLDYFRIATIEMSKKLSVLTNQEVQLTATNKMSLIRDTAESKLVDLIDSKVSDLLEGIDLSWTAQQVRDEPDTAITDTAQYLQMMFTSTLANLPYQMKALLIFREFDVLTSRFLNILINHTPPTITPQSVLNFETDMNCLEEVIPLIFSSSLSNEDGLTSPLLPNMNRESSIPVGARSPSMFFTQDRTTALMDSNVRSLKSTFDDLKQHINLLKSGSLDQYNNARMKIFPRVVPDVAHKLINKLSTYQQMMREKAQMEMMASASGDTHPSLANVRVNSDVDTRSIMSTNRKKLANLFGRKKVSKDSSI